MVLDWDVWSRKNKPKRKQMHNQWSDSKTPTHLSVSDMNIVSYTENIEHSKLKRSGSINLPSIEKRFFMQHPTCNIQFLVRRNYSAHLYIPYVFLVQSMTSRFPHKKPYSGRTGCNYAVTSIQH